MDEKGEETTPWWSEAEMRTYTFVDGTASSDGAAPADGAAYIGGGSKIDDEDGAMIKETHQSLERLRERRQSVVKNVNRPTERRKTLVNFQTNQELD